ncbi:tautomerase family protein [Cryobacterium psychrophilum]|uniref:tautomerase family protein n=1 Tax=Cryobacterium psychrophilum TaxID=41988 RepID=UPI0010F1DBF7|nr:tautomerase family protein [Cryobacterium psychrophilum]TDW30006.1 tautomerase-like protein [Cryobacterium psychrophilum]
MPFIQVKVIENVFSDDQKQEIIRNLTDALVGIEGENMRAVTWRAGRGARLSAN